MIKIFLYIPFQNRSPLIFLEYKTPTAEKTPFQCLFRNKNCFLLRGTEGGVFQYILSLQRFNYQSIEKKPFMIAPSPKAGEYQYVISKNIRESLVTELTKIKDTIKRSEQTDEK